MQPSFFTLDPHKSAPWGPRCSLHGGRGEGGGGKGGAQEYTALYVVAVVCAQTDVSMHGTLYVLVVKGKEKIAHRVLGIAPNTRPFRRPASLPYALEGRGLVDNGGGGWGASKCGSPTGCKYFPDDLEIYL